MNHSTIQKTVDAGLCTGCAMCKIVCPRKCIKIRETPGGLLEAQIENDQCSHCGACVKVCGGIALNPDAIPESVDPFAGTILKAFLVKTKDQKLRKNGQSGGAVVAIATHLLQQNTINGVVSTEIPKNGSLRPQTRLMRNVEELFESQGSKYVPVAWADAFAEINPKTDKIAVIGIPCQLRSLFNAQKSVRKTWEDSLVLKIGLVCDRTLSYAILDFIFEQCSINREKCKEYRFRSKANQGWPGEGHAILAGNTDYFLSNSVRASNKEPLTPFYCRLCFDKMNILADIVCADPWGINHDKEGHTVVLARTPYGLEVVHNAIEAGVLDAEELSVETVLKCQHVEARRTFWTSVTSLIHGKGETVPHYPIEARWFAKPVDSGTRRLNEMLLKRGKFLHTVQNRNEVLESIASFKENIDVVEKRIALWNRRNPVLFLKRVVNKILRLLKLKK